MRVETYFHFEGRVGARREWILTDVNTGKRLGCATSTWVILNYVTRRIGKMPDAVRQDYEQLAPDPPRACIDPKETRLKLPAPAGDACVRHKASPVHVDMNGHVNNTAYLTWLLDSLPPQLQTECLLMQYEVEYKAEASAGAALSGSALAGRAPAAHVLCVWQGLSRGRRAQRRCRYCAQCKARAGGNTVVRSVCCGAGDELCAGSEEVEEVQAYAGLAEGARQLVSSIRRVEPGPETELLRARTTWVKQ